MSTPGSKGEFRSGDLSVVAYLLLKDVALLRIDRHGPLSTFVFEPRAAGFAQTYQNGAEVVAKEYATSLQAAKRALFNRERVEGNRS